VSVPISTVAAVTARVASIPAPIQGEVMALTADTGDRVGLGGLVAEIGDRWSQADRRLADLRGRRGELDAQLAALDAEQREVEDLRAVYEERAREHAARVVREAEGLLAESVRAHEAFVAAHELAAAEFALLSIRRDQTHAQAGTEALRILIDADLAKARRELEHASKAVAVEAARSERLRAHVQDAKDGYFVASGVEPPRHLALLEDLGVRRSNLRIERGRVQGLVPNLDEAITDAERQVRAAAQRRIASPVSGVVWTRPVNVGQFVDVGAELYRVADVRTKHVQAYFHRRYLDGLELGDEASVYLVAARRVVRGTVKVVQAIDAGRGREEFAIDLPTPDEDHFKVVIELEAAGLEAAEIGGVVKVAVLGEVEGAFERAMMWLYLRFES
jgi:multidrug resistance efflux pump